MTGGLIIVMMMTTIVTSLIELEICNGSKLLRYVYKCPANRKAFSEFLKIIRLQTAGRLGDFSTHDKCSLLK